MIPMNNAWWILSAWVGVSLGAVACAKKSSNAPEAPPATSASAEEPPGPPPLSLVNASAVVSDCVDAKWMHTVAAHRSIQKIIDPCMSVPGGRAHFSATLLPGGRIELASPSGNPDEGVVPTCVLKNQTLRHQVFLKNRCSFDVILEERPEAAPVPSPAAVSPDPS
jgi:hypothetical protein